MSRRLAVLAAVLLAPAPTLLARPAAAAGLAHATAAGADGASVGARAAVAGTPSVSGLTATRAATVLTLRWTPAASGSVEIGVRRGSGRPARTTLRRVPARRGAATIGLGRTGAEVRVRVRARRCSGAGRTRRCGAWTRWLTPTTSSSTPATTPTTQPGASTGPGASTTPTPVGQNAPGTTTPVTTAAGEGPTIGGCPQMPSGWALNQRVDALPVAARSDAYIRFLGTGRTLHPDFGSADLGAGPDGFGIPFRVVPESQPLVRIDLGIYADESDPGPYPIPLDTPVEGGPNAADDADRHVLVVRQGECKLYELGNAKPGASSWAASVGAVFNLTTGAPRPTGWTSADAAGLPILPLLARYDEAASGRIRHAIRMTSSGIANAYVPPASHFAPSSTNPDAPPMGQRFRMKASYDLSRLTGHARVIAQAMKEYGLVLADTGSSWYVTGAPDRRWDEDDLGQLKSIPGSAFEAVDSAPVVTR